jgi:hypothetical protein
MRVVQALHWMRDLLSLEGEANLVRRKLLDDPVAGPPLKADLVDGLTTVPTWMQVFLKTVLEGEQSAPANPVAAGDDHNGDDDNLHHHRRQRSAPSSGKRAARRTSNT